MEAENRYHLTRAGAAEVARIEGRSVEEITVLPGLPKGDLAHAEGAVDILIAFAVACAKSKAGLELGRVLVERDLRRMLGNPRNALIPDAVVEFLVDGAPHVVAVEIDRNTENPAYFAKRKGSEGYQALRTAGHPILGSPSWSVAVVTPSWRRAHRLAIRSWDEGISEGIFYFAAADAISPDVILTDAWRTPRIVGADAKLVPACPVPRPQKRPAGADHVSPSNLDSARVIP